MSNLDIFDVETKQLISHANFWDYCPAGKYTHFYGISFVSNLKFIENHLLPRFSKIYLILGLSDNGKHSAGSFIRGLLTKRKNDAGLVYDDDVLKQRILDGSLSFRFTSNEGSIIHNKVYLMTNDKDYQAFVGSMNLTSAAVKKNHESLVRFVGQINDNTYKMVKQFWDNAQNWSSTYMDAKHLKGLMTSTKKQTEINFMQNSVNRLEDLKKSGNGNDVFVISSKEDLKKMHDLGDAKSKDYIKGFDDLSKDEKITVKQVVSLTGDSGKLRQKKNLQHLGSSLFRIDQVVNRIGNDMDHNNQNQLRSDEEMYPSPLMCYNEGGNFLTIGRDVHHQSVTDIKHNLSKDDVAIFPQIVHEYQDSKLDGEGHQACSFLLWLFEAPWLWKIRQLYNLNENSPKVVDDVPIRALLVGDSTTGKSTLGSRLASRLTRNREEDIITTNAREFETKSGTSNRAKSNMNTFLDGYLKAQGPVSTIFVDDAEVSYFSQGYFAKSIRDIGDDKDYLGPRPTISYSANLFDKKTGKMINTDLAVQRRMYYLAFDSPFKSGYDDTLHHLLDDANDHLYLLVQDKLREFLTIDKMTVEREDMIEEDFLYPVKMVLKEIFEQYGLFDDLLKRYFARNYNFIVDRGRVNWNGLVSSKDHQSKITFSDGGKIANMSREMFNEMAGSNGHVSGLELLNEYFESLPPKAEIASRKSDSGFNVNVERFDKFIGRSILSDLYAERTGLASHEQQSQLIASAMKQAFDYHDQKQAEEKKKHGIFGWLHRK